LSKRVVVTGIGTINPVGNNAEDSFKNLIEGKTGIGEITQFDTTEHSVKIAGEVKDFDPNDVMDKKEQKKADRFIQLSLHAAKEAIADAGVTPENTDFEQFGIVSASGIGGLPNIEKNSVVCETRGPKKISPFYIPSSLINMIGGFVSIEHGMKGPNLSAVTACAAGTHAIGEAYKTIFIGGADVMMAIGGESAVCPAGIGGFASMKALSTRNDSPETASRPFDKDRDGFVMGEGSGALILEDYDHAVKRGATIYAEVVGIGASGDANHITTPVPDGPYRAMKQAWEMAGKPKIDYINAHGTSTPANDKNETAAIKQLLGSDVPVSSTKGATGHCLGAAGAIEAVFCIKAMNENIMPPTINYTTQDEVCDLDYITEGARNKELTYVMSNSFGFGGTNGVVIFKKFEG
jgi:3-oxoacyl-[acyl-carrier-protein] synthase II